MVAGKNIVQHKVSSGHAGKNPAASIKPQEGWGYDNKNKENYYAGSCIARKGEQ